MDEPDQNLPRKEAGEFGVYRLVGITAGLVYASWYPFVEWLLPEAVNPLGGRIAISALFVIIVMLSYPLAFFRKHLRILTLAGTWVLTTHYFYLFYLNAAGGPNWSIGAYITIIAITFSMFSRRELLAYSLFVLTLGVVLVAASRGQVAAVFLPGLATILLQANFGMRHRLRLMNDVRESSERFQALFNSAFEGIAVFDRDAIIDANEGLSQIFGFGREELIGRSVLGFFERRSRTILLERMNQDSSNAFETTGIKKDGTRIPIEIRAKKLSYGRRKVRLVSFQDISIKKQVEEERIMFESAQEAVRVRDEFISIASHELNTPLTSMKIQTELTLRQLRKGDARLFDLAKVLAFATQMDRQANRLAKLVNNILDVSRISSGRLVLEQEETDIAALATEVVAGLKEQSLSAGSTVSIRTCARVPVVVDKYRMEQVIMNLVVNALKYGEGSPIFVEVTSDGANAVISVEDQGVGIAPENLDRIFSRFERAISARYISGLGLGLYIARQIVEAHGGSLAVESALGTGSKFVARIPFTRGVGAHV